MSADDSGNGINSSSEMTDVSSTDTPRQTVEPLFFTAEAVIYVAMFLVGTVGNLLIVVFLLKSSSLRTTCNVFVVHLAVVDLVIIGLGVPLSLLLIVSSDIRRYDIACNVIGRIKAAGQTSSLCILLLIAVNRYTKVCRRRHLYSRLFQTKSVALMVTTATLVGLAFACHRVGKIDAESRCCVLFVGGSGDSVSIILYVAIVAVMAVLYVHIFRTIRATRIRALQHSNPSPTTNRPSRRVAASFVHVHRGGNGNDGSPGPAATSTNSATATAAGSVHRQRGSHKNDVVANSSDASTKAVGSDARNVTSVSMNVVSSSRQAMAVRGEVREGEVEGEGEEEEEEENSSASQANVVTDSRSATKRGARRLRGIMRQTAAAAKPQDLSSSSSSSSSSGVEPDDRTRRPYATERQRGVRFVSLSPLSETEADDAAANDKSLEEDGREDCQVYQVSARQTADPRSLADPSSADSVDQGIINPCLDSGGSAQSGAAASEGKDTAPRHGTESAAAAWTTAASRCVSRSQNNSRNSSSSSSSSSNTSNNSAAAQQASTARNNATSDNYNNPAAANVFVITSIGLRRDDAENAAAVAASTRKNERRKNTQDSNEDDDNNDNDNDNDNDTTLISVARGPSKRNKDTRVEMSRARGRAGCNRTTTSAAREGAARIDRRTAAADRTEAAESAGNSLRRTKIMLTVATMFVLLYAPIIAIRAYEVLSASTARDDIRLAYAMAVTQLLVTLNSCVNFVIYGVMNGAFRLVLKQSFLRRRH